MRELQALLVRAGHAIKVDGDYGPATRDAVKAFQRRHRLAVDGIAGPETMRALDRLRQTPDEEPGRVGPLETPEAKSGGGSIVGGAAVETARRQIEQAADQTAWVPGLEWLSATLAVVAAILVVGGLAWAAYGWWKSRRTDEGET